MISTFGIVARHKEDVLKIFVGEGVCDKLSIHFVEAFDGMNTLLDRCGMFIG